MAALNVYSIGDLVRCEGALTTAAGAPVDPATVTVTVKAPDGDTTNYVYESGPYPVREAQGKYYVEVTPDQAGWWRYRFQSTGSGQAAQEHGFWVKPSAV